MDNNPERRSSESLEDEEIYVMAPEPTEDDDATENDDDIWFDAVEKCADVSKEPRHDQEKKQTDLIKEFEKLHVSNDLADETKTDKSPTQRERNNTRVIETDLDNGQQKYIPQANKNRRDHNGNDQSGIANDEISITFHALISNDIEFQADTDRVILHMWDGMYSNKTLLCEQMKFVCYRHEAKNAAEITCTVVLKKTGRPYGHVAYQYFIERSGINTDTSMPRNSLWEKVYTDSSYEKRTLHCTYQKNIEGNQYHQYDGYIYQSVHEGMWKTIKGVFHSGNKNEDAEIVTRTFARDIANTLLRDVPTSKDIIQATNMSTCLRICIERTYKIINKLVREALWEVYTNVLRNHINSSDDLAIQRRMSICMLMIKIRHFPTFNVNDPANDLICRCFLLKVDKKQQRVVEWEYMQQSISYEGRECLKEGLLRLAADISKSQRKGKNPSWIYLLPMIHLLDGTCQPFQEISLDTNHKAAEPRWWGIQREYQHVIWSFKQIVGVPWKIPLRQVIGAMQYMFEVDFYLPRTMLASLSLEELKDALDVQVFPPEICCACISFFMYSQHYDNIQAFNQLEKCTCSLLFHIETTCLGGFDQRRAWVGMHLSTDLLYAALYHNRRNTVLFSLRIFLWFIARYDILCSDTVLQVKTQQKTFSLKNISSVAVGWIYVYERKKTPDMKELLEVWDKILSPKDIPMTTRVKEWTVMIKQALVEQISSGLKTHHAGQYESRLVEAYCSGIDTYSTVLQDLLSSFILKALTTDISTEMYHKTMDNSVYIKLWKAIAKKFVEECDKIAEAHKGFGLVDILTWNALPKFMTVLYQRYKSDELEKVCNDNILHVKSSIDYCMKALMQGTISVRELKILLDHKETLIPLAQILEYNVSKVEEILSFRTAELRAFRRKQSTLETLKLFCTNMRNVQVDTGPVDAILSKNIDDSLLNELVVVRVLTNGAVEDTQDVQILARNLSKQVIGMVSRLDLLKDSVCFRRMWTEVSDELSEESVFSLDDIHNSVFQPALTRLQDKAEQISSGDISYTDMETFVGELFDDSYDTMLLELKRICSYLEEGVLLERVKQFQQCRQIISVSKLASVFVQIQKVYSLSGDFSIIYNIIKISALTYADLDLLTVAFSEDTVLQFGPYIQFGIQISVFFQALAMRFRPDMDVGNLTLTSDNKQILEASFEFSSYTKDKLLCLVAFVKCEVLVTWLREIIKGGIKEMKVFVDLAMTSAGDDTEKISRVQSLHAAVIGFSTLIFDLSREADCHDLLEACNSVWIELINTPKLPDKLEYACRYLDWFKEIQKAHGAVEVTSFMQAEMINECGIYTIGTRVRKIPDQQDYAFNFADLLDIRQVLKLTIVSDKSKGGPKEYTYDKLHDLQSRLMLVAGEAESKSSKSSVERYNSVLDGVVRLCNIYIKLLKSGCMLFQDFTIQLYCDARSDRPVVAVLEFENKGSHLKCRKTENEQLEDIMHKIASAMETCYTAWLDHVNQNREEFPELNYFTTEQLVILQKEIAMVAEKQKPSKLIYPMLHTIMPNVLPDDLIDAYKCVSMDVENNAQDERKRQMEAEDTEPVKDIESEEDKFVRELMDSGYTRLVPFALKKFPTLDIDEALFWCMDNSDNVDKLEETQYAPAENNEDENGETQDIVSIESLIAKAIDNRSQFDRCEAMLSKLNEIWSRFLDSISTHIKGFISLNQLGVILRHLSRKDERRFSRSLPKGYSEAAPNLIVCPNDEIWNQTLSLYLTDEAQPLPQQDEVLTCSEETTLEQVDIFLRRALFYANGKLHCIVNADRMSFSICKGVEQSLLKYQQKMDKSDSVFKKSSIIHLESIFKSNFRLVFICGFKSENRSVLISSLDKHRRTMFLVDVEHLGSRLAKKLKEDGNDSSSCFNAASVDFQRSTVRIVRSTRSGVGKTLYRIRRIQELQDLTKSTKSMSVSLPLHERNVDINYVAGHLIPFVEEPGCSNARIFHIDVTNEVLYGIDYLLFNLLILGRLTDRSGYVWTKLPKDLYLIETMEKADATNEKEALVLKLLPFVTCRSPNECLDIYNGKKPSDFNDSDQLFDSEFFELELYQNPYECLRRIDRENAEITEMSKRHCIETMLRHCGISHPSWSELYHFVKFLNTQLLDFQETDFVSEATMDALPGFSSFVQRFLIQMSRDFSSRSLNISEETFESAQANPQNELQEYEIKRTWEKSPHPYLFFNADRHTFTFLGFYINDMGDLVDIQNNKTLEKLIMSRNLLRALLQNGVPIKEDFDSLHRNDKIARLCRVMGVPEYDEGVYDNTYELTTDNCKKMLAVYMRFRCDIPVIVMGETGCGKTRLVKFLCELMVPRDKDTHLPLTTNMIIMKVHGGVTNDDIKAKVRNAEKKAIENRDTYNKDMYTVLFFDEANTTESIGLIKEIMCDKTMEGKPFGTCENLKFVAACNPYRRHPEEVITKLEKAGLGYHVKAKRTKDRFGRIPMRRLVYRVQPLPQSLLPFVWDFGQLDSSVENLYIRHMVRRYMMTGDEEISFRKLPNDEQLLEVVSSILTESQEYMRNLKDECSFVSLRDVDRVLQVMCWFYNKCKGLRTLFRLADQKLTERDRKQTLNDETRSLILALGVCYHACLTNREAYRRRISQLFRKPCELPEGPEQILDEIDRVQEVFLDSVSLDDNSNIAKNQALKENVFMMVICLELRLPLFLVGKPGSSKSLAKVIVTDAMQGRAAKRALFKELKQVQMVSFQCSPLSTAAGIVSTFHQCASFQENYKDNLDNFVSVVVLDEIGLAEDSETMPLKTLHPLLEDGCQGDEIPEDYKKVAFIGISNWSLDPAKMNRGIFVQREVPDSMELENTARGICSATKDVNHVLIKPLSAAYLKVFKAASEEIREFFGLRDFYSLMKMINHIVKNSKSSRLLTYRKLRFAVRRNFSGLESVDTFSIFLNEIKNFDHTEERLPGDPDDSFNGLITSWICDTASETRHLLLLTENYSALPTFQQAFLMKASIRPIIIFGSSFRRDQEYTQICRNINKIKICMETGNLVILVNSDNLYESLYDALNQYYVYFGGERYVDLGLGAHRVKCPVHRDFKLIVVAEKQAVYKRFPIPLINRLEKHCFDSSSLLSKYQTYLARILKDWVEDVTRESLSLRTKPTETDAALVFIGYHHDACSTIALEMWTEKMSFENLDHWTEALNIAKDVLLWCATPDAILRLTADKEEIQDIYWNNQAHESLKDYLTFQFKRENRKNIYSQVTTHSSLLTISHKKTLWEATNIHPNRILLLEALPSFDTEQQFISKIKDHIRMSGKDPALIVIQCDSGDKHTNLIACAKYAILEECTKFMATSTVSILFIIQLTPMENKCFHSIQCGEWHSAHIDNLYTPVVEMPTIQDMQRNRMSTLISKAVEGYQLSQDENNRQHPEKRLDLRQLIDRSLQRAVSLVKDTEEHKFRSTKRVSMMLAMLHDKSKKDRDGFVRGVGVLVENIMADQENELFSISGDNWLAKEASSVHAIQKYGTFRRAYLQAFDSRIFPIIGGIFAVLDTNHNLGILEYESGSWQRDLWINLLNTQEISQIVFTAVNTDRGIQYEVQGTGYGGRIFQCKMPFSWIIYNTLETILKRQALLFDEINDQAQSAIGILEGTKLLCALESVPKNYFYEVLECYIYDFVQMVYSEEKDRKLVLLTIKQSTIDLISLDGNISLSNTLVYVHRVYKEATSRLKYFRDISNVWTECTDALMKGDAIDNGTENDLALRGLLALTDSLASVDKKTQFSSEDGRNEWLGKIHRYRQVVKQILAFYRETMEQTQIVAEARSKWNRAVVMQLFLEILCVKTKDKLPIDRVTVLWALLSKDEVDLKRIKALEKIEKFLGLCYKKFKEDVIRDAKKCTKCGRILMNRSRVLLCQHEICGECVDEMLQDKSMSVCHKCNKPLEEDLKATAIDSKNINSVAADRLRRYRQRCNTVFMEIVSQLCYADNTSPEPRVIEWLMSYSFKPEVDEDRDLASLASDDNVGVNSDKVFKAFLFKHVVRTDEAEFRRHLEKYIQSAKDCNMTRQQWIDVIFAVIYSLEENLYDAANVWKVKEWLVTAPRLLGKEASIVDQMYGTARARIALSMCASYINMLVGQTESKVSQDIEEVLQSAKTVCAERIYPWKYLLRYLSQEFGSDALLSACKSKAPSISWIKKDEQVANTVDMYTACGENYSDMKTLVLKALVEKSNSSLLTYIQTAEEKRQMAVLLELVVHREIELQRCLDRQQINPEETEIFDEVMKALDGTSDTPSLVATDELRILHLRVTAGEDTDREINIKCLLFHWFCVIKHTNAYNFKLLRPLFKLALQPETVKNAYLPAMPQDELADIRPQLLQAAETAFLGQTTTYYQCENGHSYEIGQCGRPWVKGKCICGAEIGGRGHRLHEKNRLDDGSDRTQTGHCLGTPQNRQPGAVPERALTPTQCAVTKWLLHMTLYLGCSSGLEDICSMIQPHVEPDNIYKFLWDHILFDLEDLQDNLSLSVDEVLLFSHSFIDMMMKTENRSECDSSEDGDDMVRDLEKEVTDHINETTKADTMMIDKHDNDIESETNDDDQSKPFVEETAFIGFDREHENIIDEEANSGDIGLFYEHDFVIRSLPARFTETAGDGIDVNSPYNEDDGKDDNKDESETRSLPWLSKRGRKQWEVEFATQYINPFIEEKKQIIHDAKQHLQESSSILAMLDESATPTDKDESAEMSLLHNNPELWMYRKPVSVARFKQAFQRHLNDNPSIGNDFQVLALFLEQINELQAVRFIPRILQLHKALFRRYNRNIYQSEASNITVSQLKSEQFAGEETENLLKDLLEAWNIASHSLEKHVFRTDKDNRTALPKQFTKMQITDETPLVYLLPTMEGKGVCTFALLDFLVHCHNKLIEIYMSSGSGQRNRVFTVVSPRDLTSAHLISFQPNIDLLPIILANCSMGTRCTVDDTYDFETIEKRIIDRFLSTKSRIIVEQWLQIDLMTYRSELTDMSEIEMLTRKIQQERLDSTVKSTICNDISDVPVIGQALANLDIAINFLNITGGGPEDSLHEYMVRRLKIKETGLTAKMQQTCLLKHVKSLWMTLSYHKAYIMVQQGKSAEMIFENLGTEYHALLPEDISQECQPYVERLSKERLSQLLEVMFEFITLELTKKQNKDDEDYYDKSQYRLRDSLFAFADMAEMHVDVHDIPESILCIHSLHVWTAASQIYYTRNEERI